MGKSGVEFLHSNYAPRNSPWLLCKDRMIAIVDLGEVCMAFRLDKDKGIPHLIHTYDGDIHSFAEYFGGEFVCFDIDVPLSGLYALFGADRYEDGTTYYPLDKDDIDEDLYSQIEELFKKETRSYDHYANPYLFHIKRTTYAQLCGQCFSNKNLLTMSTFHQWMKDYTIVKTEYERQRGVRVRDYIFVKTDKEGNFKKRSKVVKNYDLRIEAPIVVLSKHTNHLQGTEDSKNIISYEDIEVFQYRGKNYIYQISNKNQFDSGHKYDAEIPGLTEFLTQEGITDLQSVKRSSLERTLARWFGIEVMFENDYLPD